MPETAFIHLIRSTLTDPVLEKQLWEELALHYNAPGRHYHNLSHLEALLEEFAGCRHLLADESTWLFTLFYHDIIYDASRQDNEEESAWFALARLERLKIAPAAREKCCRQILATKSHMATGDSDTDLFTDADLAILGSTATRYSHYCEEIRQEYIIFPDALYQPGRSRVLQHFLEMPYIYKTDWFRQRYEARARQNLAKELEMLTSKDQS